MAVINLVNGESDPVTEIVFSSDTSSDARSLSIIEQEGDMLVTIMGETETLTVSYKKDAELLIEALNMAIGLGWWDDE
jgi:hypothetical protein